VCQPPIKHTEEEEEESEEIASLHQHILKIVLRMSYISMAKNKQKGKKQTNVFRVVNKQTKQKNKAKPVTSTLKHITAVKKQKVENLNKMFTEVQRDVKSVSKCTAPKPKKPTQVVHKAHKEPANVDNATQMFSQL
ncbi:hypothetical protein UPYG_G00079650, partial [Umbra pygmaea]